MHDLAIRDALIVDGSGNPPVHGSLAVTGGRIVAIGKEVGPAHETVAAYGLRPDAGRPGRILRDFAA